MLPKHKLERLRSAQSRFVGASTTRFILNRMEISAHMESVYDLYDEIRIAFPESFEDVDRRHIQEWGSLSADYTYAWLASLANTLNHDMKQNVHSQRYSQVVSFMSTALHKASPEVHNCIDVSFVENLFWQISPSKAERYWNELPAVLKDLYLAFHGGTPLQRSDP